MKSGSAKITEPSGLLPTYQCEQHCSEQKSQLPDGTRQHPLRCKKNVSKKPSYTELRCHISKSNLFVLVVVAYTTTSDDLGHTFAQSAGPPLLAQVDQNHCFIYKLSLLF